jgi:hypothetical protein
MGVSGQRHAPVALKPRAKDPRYPLYRRLGGPQSQSGHRGYTKILFASAGDRTSTARSSSPYSDTIILLAQFMGPVTVQISAVSDFLSPNIIQELNR